MQTTKKRPGSPFLHSLAACLLAAWSAQPAATNGQGATPPVASGAPAGCTSAESGQFDFWVGRWDVYAAAQPERKIAESVIEKLYQGCAIRENWKPLRGGGDGGSLSAYAAAGREWRQTWIDSTGAWVDFRGGRRGEAMILQGRWAQPGAPNQITRMTYTVLGGGAVRQLGETSDDDGQTFQPGFDFIYRPAAR